MKKHIAISMSLVLLMNTAPVYAIETVQSAPAPAQGLLEGVETAPALDIVDDADVVNAAVAEATTTAVTAGAQVIEATEDEIAEIVGLTREQMYQKVNKLVKGFKAQKALIDAETNPTIKKLMRAQTLLAFIGSVGIGNDKTGDVFGGKKGLIIGNLSTIINGVISAIRMTSDQTSFASPEAKAKREEIKAESRKALEDLRLLFDDPSANIPAPIVKLEERLSDITASLQALEDNSAGTETAEWVRIGSGVAALVFLAGHFINPKISEEAEQLIEKAAAVKGKLAKLKDGIQKKAVAGTNTSNAVGNLGVEGIVRVFAMTSEEAEKETENIMQKLSVVIDVFEEVAASELKTR